jgi:hypothetical protein
MHGPLVSGQRGNLPSVIKASFEKQSKNTAVFPDIAIGMFVVTSFDTRHSTSFGSRAA